MKIRYLVAFSLFSKAIHSAPEVERPVERQPVDNRLLNEKEQQEKIARSHLADAPKRIEKPREPTAQQREERLHTKANELISKKKSFVFESKEERIKKFKDKVAKLDSQAKDIMLELESPKNISDDNQLNAMIQKVTRLLEQEKNISGFGLKTDRSDTFIKEIQTLKEKLVEEKNHREKQAKKTNDILEFENPEDTKPIQKKPAQKEPEAIVAQRENLLSNYSFDPKTKVVTLKNDKKATDLITHLKSLLEDKTQSLTGNRAADLDSQIETIRDALTTHFDGLRKTAEKEAEVLAKKIVDSKSQQPEDPEYLKELRENRKKMDTLTNFFDNQLHEIQDNPAYPNPKPDRSRMIARKKALVIESRNLQIQVTHLKESINNDEAKPTANQELSKLENQQKAIKREIAQIDTILNPKAKPETSKDVITPNPTSTPDVTAQVQPQEKTPQEKINEKRKEQAKNKEEIITLDKQLQQKKSEQSQAKSDERQYNKLGTDISKLKAKITALNTKNVQLENEIENLHDNRDRLDNDQQNYSGSAW